MYNRYIPQPDGSFRRHSVPDAASRQQPAPQNTPKQEQTAAKPIPPQTPAPPPPCPAAKPSRPRPSRSPNRQDAGSFLKNLLPKDFCTEDLIVVLLLLLIAGETQEEQSNALLTLALYLFL